MGKIKKKSLSSEASKIKFEEADHRLACGWHVQIEGSGQRKRYLRELKLNKEKPLNEIIPS